MKFLVELGKQLDLNVAWDGGLPDNVTYQVSSNDNAVTITNDGIVSGINVGIAVVKFINSGGVEVGSAIFEVMTAQQYEKINALRSGTKTLTVEAVEIQNTPAFTLVQTGTIFGTGPNSYMTNQVGPPSAFDGNESTYWESWESNTQVLTSYIGKQFSTPVQVKKIKIKWHTAPRKMRVSIASDAVLSSWNELIVFDVPNYVSSNGIIEWQEIILPTYSASYGIMLTTVAGELITATTGIGTIDRLRIYEIELYE